MIKGTVTSKGQITIPKEVRDTLKLDAGDEVVFELDKSGNFAKIEKAGKVCPICNGKKYIEDKECFVCQGEGTIMNSTAPEEFLKAMMKARKYNVGLGFEGPESSEHHEEGIKVTSIPKIIVVSKVYSQKLVEQAREYYQIRFIAESIKSLDDTIRELAQYTLPLQCKNEKEDCYRTSFDELKDYAKSLVDTEEGKEKVEKMYCNYIRDILASTFDKIEEFDID